MAPLGLLLNSKDRSRRARCPIILPAHAHAPAAAHGQPQPQPQGQGHAGGQGHGGGAALMAPGAFLAEPCVLYKLPNGEWWLEYYRFYTIADVQVSCCQQCW